MADPDGELHRRYGARHECLDLIRSDGYVAFRSQPADFDQLREFVGRVYRWAE